jgi:fluoroacetyl-CoA thioesterase
MSTESNTGSLSRLQRGVTGTVTWTVEPSRCVRRADRDILSTPSLVLLIEEAGMAALAPYLAQDEESVGTRIDLAHVAPSPAGVTVTATATVREIVGRRVQFEVEAADERGVVGKGSHERVVVSAARFAAMLRDREASAGQ